jgi:hypothetical protein
VLIKHAIASDSYLENQKYAEKENVLFLSGRDIQGQSGFGVPGISLAGTSRYPAEN